MRKLKTIELFAGVGGFHLGLERSGGFEVCWSNQWEPGAKDQFASNCYRSHFPDTPHACEDIEKVLDANIDCCEPELFAQEGWHIAEHEVLVGGFPCQDYSVAKPLNQAKGIKGKKGVLWWQIYRLIEWKQPRFVILENVDRLLKSPGKQRGRDFEIILSCFRDLGYAVEWRVINAADYGFAQRRRRVFLVAQRSTIVSPLREPINRILRDGILARAFPAEVDGLAGLESVFAQPFQLLGNPREVTLKYGMGGNTRLYENAGFMMDGIVTTIKVTPMREPAITLGEVVGRTEPSEIASEFYVAPEKVELWKYLKGAKKEERAHKKSGAKYIYNEGALPFPDPLDRPARTVLTAEGGASASRFKHIISDGKRYRRLIPEELEELNGFPRGWTKTGMSDIKRAFCMGNALVVGVVERIGRALLQEATIPAKGASRTKVTV